MAVLALRPGFTAPAERTERSAWDKATDVAKQAAMARSVLVRQVIDRTERGFSRRMAIHSLLSEIRLGGNKQAIAAIGEAPSEPTLSRWVDAFRRSGAEGLLTQYTGRVRKDYGWELRAQALFAEPQGRAYATVAFKLRQAGWTNATESRVRRYLKSLPSHQAETSPKRMGKHYYAQNVRPHVIRDTSSLPAGMVYTADGHTCDVYVAHPVTGVHFRAELTVWLDIATRYVVGWWLSESESAETTLFSLSHALRRHDHVPAFAHLDPGPGYKAKLISDEVTGFLARMSIEPIFALPGNAKGKGLIEGWFRWFEERCGKDFETFCGHCRTDDALRRMETRIRRGELRLPSFAEYLDAIGRYIDTYNSSPNEGLDGAVPGELWAALERTPVVHHESALMRPRKLCSVRRWRVQLDKRVYESNELRAYEGLRGTEARKVQVEYCLHDDSRVWIYDTKGRFICEAPLVEKRDWLPASRIEEGQRRRLEGQRKRLQAHLDEATARSRSPMLLADVAAALEGPEQQPALPGASGELLDRGHSLAPPPRQARALRAEEPIPDDVRDQVAAEIAAAEIADETMEQRFARAISLQAALGAGDYAEPEEVEWLRTYVTTAEYRGQRRVYDEFNRAP